MVTATAWDEIFKSRYIEDYLIKQADKEYIRNRKNKTKQKHKETLQKTTHNLTNAYIKTKRRRTVRYTKILVLSTCKRKLHFVSHYSVPIKY